MKKNLTKRQLNVLIYFQRLKLIENACVFLIFEISKISKNHLFFFFIS